MGRKQTNTVEYFPHYANASDKDTLTILENYFGNDGYAFWFKILEKLCSSEGHYIDCNNVIKWQCFVAKTNITVEIANSMVEKLVELGAIDKELWQHKVIWCQKFVDNIEEVYHNRKRTVPLKPNYININVLQNNNYGNLPVEMPVSTPNLPVEMPVSTPNLPVEIPISTPRSTQSKVEYSRVKKSRVEKSSSGITQEYLNTLQETFPQINIELQLQKFKIYNKNKHVDLTDTLFFTWCELAEEYRKQHNNGNQGSDADQDRYIKGKYGHVVKR
jgi:hypothetical protein